MIIQINEEVNKSEHKDISYRIWKRYKRGNKWVFMILPYSIEISLVISLFASYIIHVIRYLILYFFHTELIISSHKDRKDLNF